MRIYLIGVSFTLIVGLIVGCSLRANYDREGHVHKIKSVIKKMNYSLANHQLDQLLTSYSSELDWENSYGWTIRSKDTLNIYFKNWLFPQYPKLDTRRLKVMSAVEFINKKTAWVDTQQEIYSEDMKTVVRTYRQTHLVIMSGDNWLIRKTRLWIPTSHDNPPIEFLSSDSYFQ